MTLPREQDYRLYLVTREPFDPRATPAPPEQREPAWYIVQFAGPLTFDERSRLRATYQLRLRDYLPNFAYLEWLRPETRQALSKDELYRASLPYEPSDKISPGIVYPINEEAGPERELRAVLFPDADLNAFLDALTVIFRSAELRDRVREVSDSELFKVLDDTGAGGDIKVLFPLVPGEDLLKLAELRDVRWIEEVAEINLDSRTTLELTPGGLVQSGTVGLTPIWDKGITGQGQVIGITDISVNVEHCMFADATPVGPEHRKVRGQRQLPFIPEAFHGQKTAALAAGNDLSGSLASSRGMAWEAKLSLDDSSRIKGSVISLIDALINQCRDGAFIHSNSWHDEGHYNQVAANVDGFVFDYEEHFVCGSSGNNGETQIGSPGSAKNTLCVSATRNHPRELEFGDGIPGPINHGDLRFKPDICAPGCGISSAGIDICQPVLLSCASSWATPIIAGAAALVRQYYMEGWYPTGTKRAGDERAHPSAALVKATLLNSTVRIISDRGYPTRREGWGLVRLANTLFFAEEGAPKLFIRDIPNAAGLRTGESHNYNVAVRDDSRPLKITLVWSDSPGQALAARPLVNNLDLIVTSPDRKEFFGNQIGEDGFSVVGGNPDDINNVEMVIRNKELRGVWAITVSCAAANGGTGRQGYALVVTAALG